MFGKRLKLGLGFWVWLIWIWVAAGAAVAEENAQTVSPAQQASDKSLASVTAVENRHAGDRIDKDGPGGQGQGKQGKDSGEKAAGTGDPEAKELSGMSIVGNDEAPKSLVIVPWKSSEIGVETRMDMLLDDSAGPVDRDVFMRQLEFYQVSVGK